MSRSLEVEHKLLVLSNISEILIPSRRVLIHQTYLRNDEFSERVRRSVCLESGEVYLTHTKKWPGPNGGKWEEEHSINEQQYDLLLARQKPEALPITKVRYIFNSNGQVFELDHFLGPINFWLLEAEVNSLEDYLDLTEVKQFLGELVDVTHNKKFASSYISKKPNKTLKEVRLFQRNVEVKSEDL